MAERRVAELEERVRTRLSERVRAAAERLNAACAALGALDSFLGRVRFARRYDAVVPEITAGGAPAFEAARYLPLEEALSERDRRYEPISLELDVAGVITGPNMGGKTAALRLCGFLAACVALGVPVPARRARLPLFAEVAWLGFGAPAEDEGLLSAFGAEVVEVRAFFERGANPALVLIDEFARTTAPREGRALLVALLECLRNAGNVALAATHLSDVAEAAGATHYAIAGLRELTTHEGPPLPLETALRRIAERMDYRIRRVAASTPDASDALALAAILGLDRELIERARRLL